MLHRPNMPLQLSSDDLNGSAINPFACFIGPLTLKAALTNHAVH